MSYYLYAILFMIGGAYTLSRAQHVRGDVFYRLWPVRVQGGIDLVLYLFAFFPAILALISVGFQWAAASWAIGERSSTSFAAIVIYPLKAVIRSLGCSWGSRAWPKRSARSWRSEPASCQRGSPTWWRRRPS